jgi:hypothetical protein
MKYTMQTIQTEQRIVDLKNKLMKTISGGSLILKLLTLDVCN